jgi:protein SMG9
MATLAAGNGINLFVLPDVANDAITTAAAAGGDSLYTGVDEILRGYRGHGDFSDHVRELTRRLLSMPRQPLTLTALSEKNWFHYAARSWDVIRKSQLLTEYSRLQS